MRTPSCHGESPQRQYIDLPPPHTPITSTPKPAAAGAPKLEETSAWQDADGAGAFAEQGLNAAAAAAPIAQAVGQLALPALGLVGVAAAAAVGMNLFGHHVDVSVFIV
eukprot:scaffold6460_cov130-Isochrysis_galbana.AAC.10